MRFRTNIARSDWTSSPYDEVFSGDLGAEEAIKKCDHTTMVKYLLGTPLPKKAEKKADSIFHVYFIEHAHSVCNNLQFVIYTIIRSYQRDRRIQKHHNEIIQASYKKLMKHVKF